MSVRKMSVKLGMATAAMAGLAVAALAPASADTTYPWYTRANSGLTTGTSIPAGTIIGAGSDTIQFVDGDLAQAYNKANPTAPQVASLAACLAPGADGSTAVDTLYACPTTPTSGTAVFPFTFPAAANGVGGTGTFAASAVKLATSSGSGADLLANSANNGADQVPDLAFSRASGIKNSQYLDAYPFALDEVVMVTSGKVASNAPAVLTRAEIAGIYDGAYTNWDQLGGKNAPIHAYAIGNGGSGTLQAFYDQLNAEDPTTYPSRNGGNVNTSMFSIGDATNPSSSFVSTVGESGPGEKAGAASGKTIIEHDPTAIENDPDAIAAFSYSRVVTDGGAIKPVGGWVLDRAVFNEVRDGVRDSANIAGVDPNWVVGGTTGTATGPNGIVTKLFGPTGYFCSEQARSTMEADGFFQLSTSCGAEQTGSSYSGSLAAYDAPTRSTTTATVSGGTVSVSVASADATVTTVPTGQVEVAFVPQNTPGGAKPAVPAPVTATLSNGTATVTPPATLPTGTYQVAVSYLGNGNKSGDFQSSWSDGGANGDGANNTPATITWTQPAKVATTVKASASPKTLATAQKSSKVTVTVSAASGKPTGKVQLKLGSKVVGSGSLKSGKVVITVKGSKLKKGTNKITVVYTPSGNFKAPSGAKKTVTIVRKK